MTDGTFKSGQMVETSDGNVGKVMCDHAAADAGVWVFFENPVNVNRTEFYHVSSLAIVEEGEGGK